MITTVHNAELAVSVTPQNPSNVYFRPRNSLSVGAVLICIGAVGAVGALTAGYFALKATVRPWPGHDVHIDTYDGFVLFTLVILSVAFANWGAWAAFNEARRQAVVAYLSDVIISLGILNLGWYHFERFGYPANAGPYETVTWALFLFVGVLVVIMMVGALGMFIKSLLGEVGAGDRDPARAFSIVASGSGALVIFVYWLIWFVK